MRLIINHYGFHGHSTLRLNLAGRPGDLVQLSPHQARKLDRAACGIHDCECGESMAAACQDGEWTYYRNHNNPPSILIPPGRVINIRGRYPQT